MQLIFCDVCEETFSGDCIGFVFNGVEMDVCGSQCFLKFWAVEYDKAKENKITLRVLTEMEVIKSEKAK